MPEGFLKFLPYLAIMAGVTYAIRLLPMLFFRKKITNRFVRSFLYYVPYSVLSVMTVPAIFYSTGSVISAAVGCVVALVLSYFRRSLITVAAGASCAVLAVELVSTYLLPLL